MLDDICHRHFLLHSPRPGHRARRVSGTTRPGHTRWCAVPVHRSAGERPQ